MKIGAAVHRVDADPRVSEQIFGPPSGWDVRSDFAIVGNYDTRPVFLPQTAGGTDFTRALVPVSAGVEAYFEYYEALAGTEFVDASGGLLRARKDEEHYFWRPGP